MHSILALKIFAGLSEGVIKSRTSFWRDFSREKIENLEIDVKKYEKILKNADFDLICCYDANFPQIFGNIRQSEKPFLFVYRGDISLLQEIDKNVAVIGCLTPDENVVKRERKIVEKLTNNGCVIVSGLACGCDTIAHETTLENEGKTVAFLPTVLDSVYPYKNNNLSKKIVEKGGLVVSEYVTDPKNQYEKISRFVERDRLQAMFSNAVVLIASYKQGEGDSGSRHAMNKAKKYGRARYVMFNALTDDDKIIFGLNKQFLAEGATLLTQKSLKALVDKFKK